MYDDEEQKESNGQKIKQAAGRTAKQTGKKIGKKILKFLIKTGLIKYVIIAIVVILIIVIVASSSWYIHLKNALFPGDADAEGYNEYCPQAYFENIYVTENGTLMAATSVDDMWKNDKRYSRYLSNVDALAYLLNAQVVSQSPYIESAENDELNGTIKFYRDDSENPMKYVSEDTFNGYISSFNNNGDQDAKNKAMSSFTMNSNGTIKVAYQQGDTETVETIDEDYANQMASQTGGKITKIGKNSQGKVVYRISTNNSSIYTKSISYRNVIQNYSLPFELLWAIVVMADNGSAGSGNSEDFAHALASMAYDSEIDLVIDDNTETIKTEEQHSYDIVNYISYANILLKYGGNVIGHVPEEKEINELQGREHVSSLYTKVENNSSPSLRIKKIESWCAVYEGKDSFSTTTTNLPPELDESNPSTSKWTVTSAEEYSDKYSECKEEIRSLLSVSDPNDSSYTITYQKQKRSRRENDQKFTTVSTQTSSSSNAVSVTPVFNDELTDLFNVTPFAVVKRYLTKSNYKSFIDVLGRNSTTANMVDLINYIFNQVAGTDKYGKDLEFESVWKSSSFTSITESSKTLVGDNVQDMVWMAFKDAGYSDYAIAGVMGNIEQESGFNPAVTEYSGGGGFGLVQWTMTSIKEDLAAYAKSKGVSVQDEEMQINFLLGQLDETGQSDACSFAKPQQVINFDRVQSKGERACYSGWKNATSVEDATYAFCWFFEGPNDLYANMENRYNAAKKYYEQYHS